VVTAYAGEQQRLERPEPAAVKEGLLQRLNPAAVKEGLLQRLNRPS
jgi:hypothetical protein